MAMSSHTSIRLIGGSDARGLSGDARRVLPSDPALAFFDSCLRRHRTPADLVADPGQVWQVLGSVGRGMGLEAHLQAASRERLFSLSELLVVVSDADWARSVGNHGPRWMEHLKRSLHERFEAWCAHAGVSRRQPAPPVRFRVLVDGSSDTHGQRIGLGPGEFVTGLLPNLYAGPSPSSRPLISLMVHLPGEWEGYREVARLYEDQDLLTLGNHWLDNFSHPALVAPALYRLQYDPDGGLIHLTSPDVSGGYTLTRHDASDEASVYGLVRGDGHVVAWLVLAVVDTSASPAPEAVGPTAPLRSSAGGAPTWQDGADGGTEPFPRPPHDETRPHPGDSGPVEAEEPTLSDVETMPTVPASSEAVDEVSSGLVADASAEDPEDVVTPRMVGTARAAGVEGGLVTVREAGVLLQRVHFRDVMLGYEVYISATGEVGSDLPDPAATVQVVGRHVRLFAHRPGVRVAEQEVPVHSAVVLGASTQLDIAGVVLDYHDRKEVCLRGWPYLGEIRRPGANIHLTRGGTHAVGRDPQARVRLPDDSHHGNIIWRPEVDGGATIRSRNGEIPKARFTLDSIMVASHHAELDLTAEAPRLLNTANHCFSFVGRPGATEHTWITLSRQQRALGTHETFLQPGDELYIGNCILRVDWADEEAPTRPSLQPPPMSFSMAEDAPDVPLERFLPPLPTAPIPPLPPLVEPTVPPPDGEPRPSLLDEESETAPTWDTDPTTLPDGEEPPPFVPVTPTDSIFEEDSIGISPLRPVPDASVEEAWSPLSEPWLDGSDDDPTAVPLPRLMADRD